MPVVFLFWTIDIIFLFVVGFVSCEKLSAEASSLMIATLLSLGILSLGILSLFSAEFGDSIVGDLLFLVWVCNLWLLLLKESSECRYTVFGQGELLYDFYFLSSFKSKSGLMSSCLHSLWFNFASCNAFIFKLVSCLSGSIYGEKKSGSCKNEFSKFFRSSSISTFNIVVFWVSSGKNGWGKAIVFFLPDETAG